MCWTATTSASWRKTTCKLLRSTPLVDLLEHGKSRTLWGKRFRLPIDSALLWNWSAKIFAKLAEGPEANCR